MSTLVVCIDRTDEIGRKTGHETPVTGPAAVRDLVLDLGVSDPEDSGVNALLETLRITEELQADGEAPIPVVVSGSRESIVLADRSIAEQLDEIIAEHAPTSSIVVLDSAQDERVVPIVESRLRVDSVDRVVVRQARDLESTYYLLKQFMADEELRPTILVPIGITLLVFPALSLVAGTAYSLATITAVIGLFLLYKGIGVESHLARLDAWVRRSLYSGQVSIVTYAVAAGLVLVGLVAGGLGASDIPSEAGWLMIGTRFVFDTVLWAVGAGLIASTGRLLDLVIQEHRTRAAYLNVPFLILGVGLVLRGFSGYLLARAGHAEPIRTPAIDYGILSLDAIVLAPGEGLVLYVLGAIAISVLGARFAAVLNERAPWHDELTEGDRGSS
ncbi:MAG: DUF373 family protein [Halobacteriales archaeon]